MARTEAGHVGADKFTLAEIKWPGEHCEINEAKTGKPVFTLYLKGESK